MKLKLKEIAQFCSGTLFGDGEIEIDGFFTDSREAEAGKMFVPIRGEHVDAHRFIPTLPERGCRATFSQVTQPDPKETGISYILVSDTRGALQKTAESFRETLTLPVIGITGSVGKTTTKEMIALALGSQWRIHKTQGNANSQIGLPRTVLAIEPEDQAAVLEMGMSLPGEMARIARVAKPDFAVITNIGVSHIEFHGSRENILAEKLHIADYLGPEGKLFVNGDDPLLRQLEQKDPRPVTFGVSEGCSYRAVEIEQTETRCRFLCVREGKTSPLPVTLPVPGLHNIRNALAALAITEALGLSPEKAAEALSRYQPPEMRQQIKKYHRVTVIDDSYNASPDSVRSAIDVLCQQSGRKIAVLADMLELGSYAEQGHREIGRYAREQGVDLLLGVGPLARYITEGFGDPDRSRHFETNEEALEFLHPIIAPDDAVLVKGSRGMKTDTIVKSLEERLSEHPILSPEDRSYLQKIAGYYQAVVEAKTILADAISSSPGPESSPLGGPTLLKEKSPQKEPKQ